MQVRNLKHALSYKPQPTRCESGVVHDFETEGRRQREQAANERAMYAWFRVQLIRGWRLARIRALVSFYVAEARRDARRLRDSVALRRALRHARRFTELSASVASRDVEGSRPLRGPPSLPV